MVSCDKCKTETNLIHYNCPDCPGKYVCPDCIDFTAEYYTCFKCNQPFEQTYKKTIRKSHQKTCQNNERRL